MNRKLVTLTMTALLLCAVSVMAASPRAYPVVRHGDRVYVDSLAWSNGQGLGAGGLIDTLVAASLRDTSDSFPLTNLAWLSAMQKYDAKTNVAGTVTCSLEVSLDGTNWFRPETEAVFSSAASAIDHTDWVVLYASAGFDTMVTADEVSGGTAQSVVGASRLGRFVTVMSTATADTVFSQVYTLRQYKRR